MSHRFLRIAERYDAYEISLNDDSAGGLIDKLKGPFPEVMPANEVLIYQWLPPRRDSQGQPIEVSRLRFVRVPVGDKGPLVSQIVKILDEMDVPKMVKMPEKLDIPEIFEAAKDEATLDIYAAQMGMTFPAGASIKAKRVLLAREALTAPGKALFNDLNARYQRQAVPASAGG